MIVKHQQSSIAPVVVAAQRGDKHSMTVLYNRSFRYCYKHLKGYFDDHNTICDVISDVWLVVLKKIHTVHTPGAFLKWVKRIAHTRAINRLERDRFHLSIIETITPDEAVDDSMIHHESSELIAQLISRLCANDQQCIREFYFNGLPLKKIAKKLNCPLGTARRRLFVARNRLRKMIAADPDCRRELLAIVEIEE